MGSRLPRHWQGPLLVATAVIVAACGADLTKPASSAAPGDGWFDTTPWVGAPMELECERDGYPCSQAEVGPAVLAREAEYVDEITVILASGSYADALAWIRAQDSVVEAEADERSLWFRLEGGMPVPLFDIVDDPPVAASSGDHAVTFASAGTPAGGRPDALYDVVGSGTHRDNPLNRKKALFLMPFEWQGHSLFGLGRPDIVEKLREIPDFRHHPADVVTLVDEQVTPRSFQGWQHYDAVFVRTHGGVYEQTVLATGVKALLRVDGVPPPEGPQPSIEDVCERLMSDYAGIAGVRCTGIRHITSPDPEVTEIWAVVGLLADFFVKEYGKKGGLPKTIVYIGGCHSLRTDKAGKDIAFALAGGTSAVVGWDDAVITARETRFAWELLDQLIIARRTIRGALQAACFVEGCGGPQFGATARLAATPAARELRLYDLPTVRDPAAPTNILEPGAELRIIGSPGDGRNDQLDITVDLIGIIDPDGTAGDDLIGSGEVTLAGAHLAQADDPAGLYNLRVYVDAAEVGADNLGHPRPAAAVISLGDDRYRYALTTDLPFDVAPDGTAVTLKVEVDLPEGGTSDHEVDVRLVGLPAGEAVVTIGATEYRFSLATRLAHCRQREDGFLEGIAFPADADPSTYVQSDGVTLQFTIPPTGWVDPEPDLWSSDDPRVEVIDYPNDLHWKAGGGPFPGTTVTRQHSRVDAWTLQDGVAWGSALFIETGAAIDTEVAGQPPVFVPGTFVIDCALP